jgi:DHA2 family multidrug resistance protein
MDTKTDNFEHITKQNLNYNSIEKRNLLSNAVETPRHQHPSYKWWVLVNVMFGTFMVVLDSSIVDVSMPTIMSTFGVTVDTAKWIATAYLLALATMLPTSGWVADRFGYKRTYAVALSLFTGGSLLCSLSWSITALIAFRVIQGIGGGLLLPVGMAIVMREFPIEKRGTALGFWSVSSAASVSLGPTLGGYLIDNYAWHSIYDINVPIGILAIFATLIIQREYRSQKVHSFDAVGFVSMALFLTTLLLALSDGNADWNTGGWTSPFTLSCFGLSLIGLVTFVAVEFNIREPLVDLSLLKNFNFGMANLVLFIFGMGMFGSTFLLPLYLQNGLGYTAFQAGSLFLPLGFLQGTMGPLAGYLSDRVNPKYLALYGVIVLSLSLFSNHFLSLFSETHSVMISIYLRGLGMGFIFTPLSSLSLSQVPKEKMARASGLYNVLRQVGGSFGVAIMGTLLTDRTTFHETFYGEAVNKYSPVVRNALVGLKSFAQQAVGGNASISSARAQALLIYNVSQQAFVSAVDDDFYIAAAITLLCVIPVLLLRSRKKSSSQKVVSMD